MEFLIGALLLAAAFYVGWNIGANDAANCIGTTVGSQVLSYRNAALLMAVFVILGGVLQGHYVMKTVGKGIVITEASVYETYNEQSAPAEFDEIDFIFSHPHSLELVIGTVDDLSAAGVSFIPADRNRTAGIEPGDHIRVCSLALGDEQLSFPATVVRNERTLSLNFDSLTPELKSTIRTYIDSHTQRELHRVATDVPTELEPV